MLESMTLPNYQGTYSRYWYWRGWRIRYAVLSAACPSSPAKPPLLLLHGFGASLEQWRYNLHPLAQNRTVYALDLLGFGDSQKAATILSTDLWSAQVYDFWTLWVRSPVVLAGHSLGALVALNTAVTYPDMTAQLVLLTLPAAREELLSGWLESWSRSMERLFSTPVLIRLVFQIVRQPWVIRRALQSIYRIPAVVDAELVNQFVQPTRDRGAARTLCYLVASRTQLQFAPRTQQLIPQLTVPTLLLWGQADNVIPLAWGERIAPLNPRVTLTVVAGAGHCLYDEVPAIVNDHILTWLEAADRVSSS